MFCNCGEKADTDFLEEYVQGTFIGTSLQELSVCFEVVDDGFCGGCGLQIGVTVASD